MKEFMEIHKEVPKQVGRLRGHEYNTSNYFQLTFQS